MIDGLEDHDAESDTSDRDDCYGPARLFAETLTSRGEKNRETTEHA